MADGSLHTPKFELLIDGSPAPEWVLEDLILVRARQDLELMDMLELQLNNSLLAYSESDVFLEGKEVGFKVGYEGGAALELVATGEVVRREFDFPKHGAATLTVVAYDRKHRLKRGVRNRVWPNEKDSGIASRIAQENGLYPNVTDTQVVQDYVLQHEQTDLAFLRERAQRYDYEVDVDTANQTLYFGPPRTSGSTAIKLAWGEDLYSFETRLSTDSQVSKIRVQSWDIHEKRLFQTDAAPQQATHFKLDAQDTGAQLAERTFGGRDVLYVNRPFQSKKEGDLWAEAQMNALARRFCEGTATAQGEVKIQPGTVVEIDGCGQRLNGRYYVTQATHFVEGRLGFVTHFDVVRAAERAKLAPPQQLPPVLPPRQAAEPEPEPNQVTIDVTDHDGRDLTGTKWTATTADGQVHTGTLDSSQRIQIEGVRDPGDVKVELSPPDEGHTDMLS